MIERFSVWLVILSTVLTALPASGGVVHSNQSEEDAQHIQAEKPPSPVSTDGRRGSERAKPAQQFSQQQRSRSASSWWSWLVVLSMFCPCFVLASTARPLQGQETSPALESTIFQNPADGGPNWIAPVNYEQQADPQMQPCPPALPGCWLSGGHIALSQIEHYPRIPTLDKEGGLFDTWRPNLFGKEVPVEWDFQNLINTDRPDFTDAPYTVGRGVALLETGYTFRKTNVDGLNLERRQLPEALLRVGMTDEFEFRIKWNGYILTDASDTSTGLKQNTAGTDDMQLGFKYEIWQQEGWRPLLTYVGGITVPTGTNGVSANQIQPFGNIVYGWGLRRWLYLKGSTGVDFVKSSNVTHVISGSLQEGPNVQGTEDNESTWHQSFSLLFQATPRVGGFLEWFSFFSNNSDDNRPSHFLDTGLYIYITPNVQLDVRIGERVSDRVDTLFTGAGFSTRW